MSGRSYPVSVAAIRVVASNHRCPLGYAPKVSSGECMYCEHDLLSSCHMDYGKNAAGEPITHAFPGPDRLAIRYGNQTVVYNSEGGRWIDLRAIAREVEATLKSRSLGDAAKLLEQLSRVLPEPWTTTTGDVSMRDKTPYEEHIGMVPDLAIKDASDEDIAAAEVLLAAVAAVEA